MCGYQASTVTAQQYFFDTSFFICEVQEVAMQTSFSDTFGFSES